MKKGKMVAFPASREVIDATLLDAIDGDSHVCVVLSMTDLDELIDVLETCRASTPRIVSFIADLKRLMGEAFPPPHAKERR